jgi:hypothetical protein
MKAIYLLFTMIVLALSVNTVIAQTVIKTIPDNLVERKYDKEIYLINSDTVLSQSSIRSSKEIPGRIYTTIMNKDKGVFNGGASGCYFLKETTPLTEIFKQAIPKEKIKSLALNDKNGIFITYYYDTKTGKVAHLKFNLRGIILSDDMDSETDITLKDINKLESLFKEYHFDVSNLYCDKLNREIEFGNWNQVFWFSKLAEEEKEK